MSEHEPEGGCPEHGPYGCPAGCRNAADYLTEVDLGKRVTGMEIWQLRREGIQAQETRKDLTRTALQLRQELDPARLRTVPRGTHEITVEGRGEGRVEFGPLPEQDGKFGFDARFPDGLD